MNRKQLFATTALSALILPQIQPSHAEDDLVADDLASLPAVSAPNGKIAIGSGAFDGDFIGYLEAAFTIPLEHRFGFQADALVGETNHDRFYHGAGHLFWRDPAAGMLGVYGSITNRQGTLNNINHHVLALEAEAYFDQITVSALVGHEDGAHVEDGILVIADLSFYPADNIRTYLGVRHIQDETFAAAGVEAQLSQPSDNLGLAVFGEGRLADDDEYLVSAGMRVYFGAQKALINRHREDDPIVRGKEFLFAIEDDTVPSGPPEPLPEPAPIG